MKTKEEVYGIYRRKKWWIFSYKDWIVDVGREEIETIAPGAVEAMAEEEAAFHAIR